MIIKINPRRTSRNLLFIVSLLLIANIIAITLKLTYYSDPDSWRRKLDLAKQFILMFDFDTENNLPTMFSSLILFFSAVLLFLKGLHYKNNSNNYFGWMGLSLAFLFLSIDEMISLHEHLTSVTKSVIHTSGAFFNAWVIPYVLVLLLVLPLYYKFLLRLPKKTLYLFLLSFFIYVMGAVGLEMIEGSQYEVYGETPTLYYSVLYTVEETMEMLGIILFIYTLLSFHTYTISINVDKALQGKTIKSND